MIAVHLELPPTLKSQVQETLKGLMPHLQPLYLLSSLPADAAPTEQPSILVTTPLSIEQGRWLEKHFPGVPWYVFFDSPSFSSVREQLELGAYGLATGGPSLETLLRDSASSPDSSAYAALVPELEALLELPLSGHPTGLALAGLLHHALQVDAVWIRYEGKVFGHRSERVNPFSDTLEVACHALSLSAGDRGLLVLARTKTGSGPGILRATVSLAARLLRPQLQRESLLSRIVSAKREWEATADTIPDPILLLDSQHRVIRSNQAFARLVGCSVREVIGQTFEAVTGTAVEALTATSQHASEHLQQPISLARVPGRQFNPVHFQLELERVADGYYLRDVTEERQLLSMVMQTERYSAFGELSHMLFHDLGSPAAALKMEVESALAILEDLRTALNPRKGRPGQKPPELLQELEQSLEGARDASERVHQLLLTLQQYRQLRRDPESDEGLWVDLNRILATLPRLYRSLAKRHNIEMEVMLEPLPVIVGNSGELMRVFENLIRNAIEAQPNGGQILVRAQTEGSQVRIEVEDRGPGISPELQARIFERGFSTRLREGGTGLGLYYSEQIVRRHGGSITVSSTVAQGSCFVVLLPTAEMT